MGVLTYSVFSGYKSADVKAFEGWIDRILLADRQNSEDSDQALESEPDEEIDRMHEYRRWRRRLPEKVRKYAPYISGREPLIRN
jgi:hypothetical protein